MADARSVVADALAQTVEVNGGESVADLLGRLVDQVQEARDAIESDVTERFRKALMVEHHHDWSMEVVSEAAHVCARSLVAAFFDESATGGPE